MPGGMDSCGSLHEQLTMQLCALTAATHVTGILGLIYSESLMSEYLACWMVVDCDAATRL